MKLKMTKLESFTDTCPWTGIETIKIMSVTNIVYYVLYMC